MATQSQKFNGKNFYNNRVEVDFETRGVLFEPIEVGNLFSFTMQLAGNLFSIFWALWFYILGVQIVITVVLYMFDIILPDTIAYGMIASLILGMICCPIIAILLMSDVKWREHKFPKFNYDICVLAGRILRKKPPRWKEINPKAVVNRKLVIPNFSNVMFQYKLRGDFADNIKNITIQELKVGNDDGDWFVVIEFKKEIRHGRMWVKYL